MTEAGSQLPGEARLSGVKLAPTFIDWISILVFACPRRPFKRIYSIQLATPLFHSDSTVVAHCVCLPRVSVKHKIWQYSVT